MRSNHIIRLALSLCVLVLRCAFCACGVVLFTWFHEDMKGTSHCLLLHGSAQCLYVMLRFRPFGFVIGIFRDKKGNV